MLNTAKHEIFPALKCLNAKNCRHFNIYEQEKKTFWAYTSLKNADFLGIFILMSI